MTMSRNAVGNLISRYKTVLKNCSLLNTFGTLALAGALVLGGVSGAIGAVVHDRVDLFGDFTDGLTKKTFTGDSFEGIVTTGSPGGAISISIDLNLNDTTFEKNSGSLGGAIYIYGADITMIDGAFDGNTATGYGGAVASHGNRPDGGGEHSFTDVDFDNNSAGDGGGAIRLAEASVATFNVNKDLAYTNNKAKNLTNYDDLGGFLYCSYDNKATFNIADGKTLTIGEEGAGAGVDSIASLHDGAVFTKKGAGTMTVNGSMESYTGAINVEDGTLNLAGGFGSTSVGIQADLNWNQTSAVATDGREASILTVSKGATANLGDLAITFAPVDGSGAGTIVNVEDGATFTAKNVTVTSKLYQDRTPSSTGPNGEDVTTYGWGQFDIADGVLVPITSLTVGQGARFDAMGGTLAVSGDISNAGKITFNGSNTLSIDTASKVTVEDSGSISVAPGATMKLSGKPQTVTINNVIFDDTIGSGNTAWGWDNDGDDTTFDERTLVVDSEYLKVVTVEYNDDGDQDDDSTYVITFEEDTDAIANGEPMLGTLGGVIPGLANVNASATANMGTRTALLPLLDDVEKGLSLWAIPMYGHTSANGFKAGNGHYGYDTNVVGVSFGADYTFESDLRLGLAGLVGAGNVSSKGDFESTENDFDYVGISLYGAHHLDRLGLSFDMNYIVSENDMTQDNIEGDFSGDADASLFTIGAKAEYLIPFHSFNVIPYAGIRFNYYDVDGYDTMQNGVALLQTENLQSTIWEVPVGVSFNTTTQVGSWEMTPSLGLGVKFAMGDLDTDQSVRLVGGTSTVTLPAEIADEVTFQGALGLGFDKDNWTIGLNYNLDLSENVESHGVNFDLRYEF